MNWISAKLKSFVEKAKNTFKRQQPSKDDQEKPKILDEPLSIDDDEIPF